ncbi:cobalt transporter [Rhodonellum psychrophilum GCM71 = DSM 17998]|uniref:Cobalt transporter n=2 Tax=Rhodonellum TaxID=336827 RepID=U5C7G7_9BACT|nr:MULTISPECIES: Co2+/Mg2+ efflux protein ApaG [Rhodonellum]ERM84162.1 cobalt transporter [Rhodonellum psychrophilum GCM71 = DSM 17998]SDZ19909.1 ApaG protein [Rhodonellum ikkaensis]
MITAITEGIVVTVEVTYQAEFSSPHQHHFVFTYKVSIENKSPFTIQLLRRKWEISDAGDIPKIVEGDGVIGQQPILEPGDSHHYVSGCNLKSGLGKMKGFYYMEKVLDGKIIEVAIPEFHLISPIFNN